MTRSRNSGCTPQGSTPQVIVMLDRAGRVIQASCALAGARLGEVARSVAPGRSVHEIVHPGCTGCVFDAAWSNIWNAFDSNNIPETEIEDPVLRAVLRLRLQRPLQLDSAPAGEAGCLAVLTVNDITEYRAAQLRHVSRLLFVAEENERKRIAAELHDGVCQSLGTIKYRLEALQNRPAVAGRDVALLAEHVRHAIEEIRRIATNLAPTTLEDSGIGATLQRLCADFRALHPDMRLSSRVQADERRIPPILKVAIHRLTQEALNNAAAHASAHEITVTLLADPRGLELCIRDDGRGFDCEEVSRQAGRMHFGLRNMRDRVAATNGVLEINSARGVGTEVCARWDVAELSDMASPSACTTG